MIEIDGTSYKLGINLHVRLLYERMAGKIFGMNMMTLDQIILFFAALVSFNRDEFKMSFEEFVDYLDRHEDKMQELIRWEVDYFKTLVPDKEEQADGKKKD